MSIVCGTDFSEPAERAMLTAAQLAAHTRSTLHLVHAVQVGAKPRADEPKSEYLGWAERQLERRAAIARELDAEVQTHLEYGAPDEALIDVAARVAAELIVIGPLGSRSSDSFRIGGHADKLAQRSHVPVFIVRDVNPFQVWLRGQRPLRVVLGADLSRSTDAAMAFVDSWKRMSACDVTAVHLYWPPQQFERLGLGGVRSYLDPDPDVTKTLTRELLQRLAPPGEPGAMHVHVEPHLGRLGDRLADIAFQREADVLVVGTHSRNMFGRVWEGSVSRWALHAARTSVVCVPAPAADSGVHVPRLRSVLAATDFSPTGNAAIALAYALCEPGGTVMLAHIVPERQTPPLTPHDIFSLERDPSAAERRAKIHTELKALIPVNARDRLTQTYALESNDVGAAVCQAALRLDADAICLGRRGRSNLAQTILGSVSKDVLEHAERPVLLAQSPRS